MSDAAAIALPARPRRSSFAIAVGVAAIVMTVVSAMRVDFAFSDLLGIFEGPNPVARGIADIRWDEMFSDRSRAAFLETLQLAVLGTTGGVIAALPLSLWSTTVGNPYRISRAILRAFNNVIRAIPDLLWAGLFVLGVGVGALAGLLALFFFSMAVMSKLTSDTLDGIDMGPVEAANATGASHTQMLRTAVIPQILPAYTSFALYDFELNLRASAVLGLVGAGGIGQRLAFFQNQQRWDQLWGLVFMFFLVVFVVERLSVTLRRRLV